MIVICLLSSIQAYLVQGVPEYLIWTFFNEILLFFSSFVRFLGIVICDDNLLSQIIPNGSIEFIQFYVKARFS